MAMCADDIAELRGVWERLRDITHPSQFAAVINDCPLCAKYKLNGCLGCPVFAKTKRSNCRGVSELYSAHRAHRQWAAGRIDREAYQSVFDECLAFINDLDCEVSHA